MVEYSELSEAWEIVRTQFPLAIWETVYVTFLATLFAVIIGLPLGVLLVTGDKDGIRPLPSWLMKLINVVINLLRSVPFLIVIIVRFVISVRIVSFLILLSVIVVVLVEIVRFLVIMTISGVVVILILLSVIVFVIVPIVIVCVLHLDPLSGLI